jgi:hypothetical protein
MPDVWVCDYDVPREPSAAHMRFYRRLWKLLRSREVTVGKRSTQSVWISDDEGLIRGIHELACEYGRSHLYAADRLD